MTPCCRTNRSHVLSIVSTVVFVVVLCRVAMFYCDPAAFVPLSTEHCSTAQLTAAGHGAEEVRGRVSLCRVLSVSKLSHSFLSLHSNECASLLLVDTMHAPADS